VLCDLTAKVLNKYLEDEDFLLIILDLCTRAEQARAWKVWLAHVKTLRTLLLSRNMVIKRSGWRAVSYCYSFNLANGIIHSLSLDAKAFQHVWESFSSLAYSVHRLDVEVAQSSLHVMMYISHKMKKVLDGKHAHDREEEIPSGGDWKRLLSHLMEPATIDKEGNKEKEKEKDGSQVWSSLWYAIQDNETLFDYWAVDHLWLVSLVGPHFGSSDPLCQGVLTVICRRWQEQLQLEASALSHKVIEYAVALSHEGRGSAAMRGILQAIQREGSHSGKTVESAETGESGVVSEPLSEGSTPLSLWQWPSLSQCLRTITGLWHQMEGGTTQPKGDSAHQVDRYRQLWRDLGHCMQWADLSPLVTEMVEEEEGLEEQEWLLILSELFFTFSGSAAVHNCPEQLGEVARGLDTWMLGQMRQLLQETETALRQSASGDHVLWEPGMMETNRFAAVVWCWTSLILVGQGEGKASTLRAFLSTELVSLLYAYSVMHFCGAWCSESMQWYQAQQQLQAVLGIPEIELPDVYHALCRQARSERLPHAPDAVLAVLAHGVAHLVEAGTGQSWWKHVVKTSNDRLVLLLTAMPLMEDYVSPLRLWGNVVAKAFIQAALRLELQEHAGSLEKIWEILVTVNDPELLSALCENWLYLVRRVESISSYEHADRFMKMILAALKTAHESSERVIFMEYGFLTSLSLGVRCALHMEALLTAALRLAPTLQHIERKWLLLWLLSVQMQVPHRCAAHAEAMLELLVLLYLAAGGSSALGSGYGVDDTDEDASEQPPSEPVWDELMLEAKEREDTLVASQDTAARRKLFKLLWEQTCHLSLQTCVVHMLKDLRRASPIKVDQLLLEVNSKYAILVPLCQNLYEDDDEAVAD
jgi:hypothetical protein